MKSLKLLYVRVSSIDQKTDRQKINESDYDRIVVDKCSGAIPFFQRQGGKEIQKLIGIGAVCSLSVLAIDRLGRNLKDILNTIEFFNEHKVPIKFESQGLTTLDSEGKENNIAKLIISILGSVADMERIQIRERQQEGILLAKQRKAFTGRKAGSKEDTFKFLNKPKNKQALEYIKRTDLTLKEISKLAGVHINTLTKVKRLGFS